MKLPATDSSPRAQRRRSFELPHSATKAMWEEQFASTPRMQLAIRSYFLAERPAERLYSATFREWIGPDGLPKCPSAACQKDSMSPPRPPRTARRSRSRSAGCGRRGAVRVHPIRRRSSGRKHQTSGLAGEHMKAPGRFAGQPAAAAARKLEGREHERKPQPEVGELGVHPEDRLAHHVSAANPKMQPSLPRKDANANRRASAFGRAR